MEATPRNENPAVSADVLEPAPQGVDALPVPKGPRRDLDPPEKQSIWKRLARRGRRRDALSLDSEELLELSNRLAVIESRLGLIQDSFQQRLHALEQRLDEVWEAEEQLSQLIDMQAKLDQLLSEQKELREGASKNSSNAGLWALVAVLSIALAATLGDFLTLG